MDIKLICIHVFISSLFYFKIAYTLHDFSIILQSLVQVEIVEKFDEKPVL